MGLAVVLSRFKEILMVLQDSFSSGPQNLKPTLFIEIRLVAFRFIPTQDLIVLAFFMGTV